MKTLINFINILYKYGKPTDIIFVAGIIVVVYDLIHHIGMFPSIIIGFILSHIFLGFIYERVNKEWINIVSRQLLILSEIIKKWEE